MKDQKILSFPFLQEPRKQRTAFSRRESEATKVIREPRQARFIPNEKPADFFLHHRDQLTAYLAQAEPKRIPNGSWLAREPLTEDEKFILLHPGNPSMWKIEARLLAELNQAKTDEDTKKADDIRRLIYCAHHRLQIKHPHLTKSFFERLRKNVVTAEQKRINSLPYEEQETKHEWQEALRETEQGLQTIEQVFKRHQFHETVREALEIVEAYVEESWKNLERLIPNFDELKKQYEIFLEEQEQTHQKPRASEHDQLQKTLRSIFDWCSIRDQFIYQLLVD
ncbi:MAG TPA: hypothetical protein VFQ60_00765 [Patescibacteria group bacterium]|nr:hypothetical protein [Patescibacteria group bacterium]